MTRGASTEELLHGFPRAISVRNLTKTYTVGEVVVPALRGATTSMSRAANSSHSPGRRAQGSNTRRIRRPQDEILLDISRIPPLR